MKVIIKIFTVVLSLAIISLLFAGKFREAQATSHCNPSSRSARCEPQPNGACNPVCANGWTSGSCPAGVYNCSDVPAECSCGNGAAPCYKFEAVCGSPCNDSHPNECGQGTGLVCAQDFGRGRVCWKSSCETSPTPTPTPALPPPSCVNLSTTQPTAGTVVVTCKGSSGTVDNHFRYSADSGSTWNYRNAFTNDSLGNSSSVTLNLSPASYNFECRSCSTGTATTAPGCSGWGGVCSGNLTVQGNPPTCTVNPVGCVERGTPVTFSATSTNSTRMGIYKRTLAPGTWSTVADTGTCNPYSGSCSGSTIFDSTGEYEVVCNAYNDNGLTCSGNPWCDYNPSPNQPPISCPGVTDCTSNDRVRVTVVDSCAPPALTCQSLYAGATDLRIGGSISLGCVASETPNHANLRYSIDGGTWSSPIIGTPNFGNLTSFNHTFNQGGQHIFQCQVCSSSTACTAWDNSACQLSVNVPVTPTPPTITITPSITPPTSSITPTPPTDCINLGIDEHSNENLSNLIKIQLTPTKNITLFRTLTCAGDGICDVEGMDNRPGEKNIVYFVANKTTNKIYTVDTRDNSATVNPVVTLQDNRRYEGLSFRPGDAPNFVWGGSPNSGNSPGLYKINLTDGSAAPKGGIEGSSIYTKSITWNNDGTKLYVSTHTHLLAFDYNLANDTLNQTRGFSIALPGGNTDAMDMTDDGYIVGSYKSGGELVFYFLNPVLNPAASALQNAQAAGQLYQVSLTDYNNQLALTGSSFNNLDAFVWLCGNNPSPPSPTPATSVGTPAITANINPASLSNAAWEAMINDSLGGTCDAACLSRRISETFSCHVPGLQKQTCDPTRGECQIFTPPCYFQNVGTPI